MPKLIYIINLSLDGYINDETGAMDWLNPQQVHEFITELMQPVGTYLYGRRIYETMLYWDAPEIDSYEPEQRAFARVWQKAHKIVFSRTLKSLTARNTHLEPAFDPEAIRKLKRESGHDIAIAGAELAGVALEANLIDELHLFIHPAIVGGGQRALPAHLRRNLGLLETRRFDTGVVHLHYRVRG